MVQSGMKKLGFLITNPFMTTRCMCLLATFAPMKAVVWFFVVWLLVLTGLPCPDADCHTQGTQMARSSTSHADDPDHKAPCSPFCHCTTCAGFAAPRLFRYALPNRPDNGPTVSQTFHYQSTAYSAVAFAIWQPPRI